MRETLATILWEGWTALVLCAAAVFLPGSEALTYPAVLWPGLVLAAAVPAGWAFWALAEQPAPLPPEQLLEKQKPPYRVPDTEVLFVSRSLDQARTQAFLLARFAIRLILREAVFFLMTPLARALSIAETAARTVASLSAALASMAASAFLTTVFRLVLMALL